LHGSILRSSHAPSLGLLASFFAAKKAAYLQSITMACNKLQPWCSAPDQFFTLTAFVPT